MRKLLLLLFCSLCVTGYSQSYTDKIIPKEKERSHPQRNEKFGYVDILDYWLIEPQFTFAYGFDDNGIALVSGYFDAPKNINPARILGQVSSIATIMSGTAIPIEKRPKASSEYLWCFIDLNGDILVKYPLAVSRQLSSQYSIRHVMPNVSEEVKNTTSVVPSGDKYYKRALKEVDKRNSAGAYDNFYTKIALIDHRADLINTAKVLRAQIEKARQDSILIAETAAKRIRDSLIIVERFRTDSIAKVNAEKRLIAQIKADSVAKIEDERRRISEQQKRNRQIAEQKAREEQRKRDNITKYGVRYGALINEGRVAIGMTKEMCVQAWGKPRDINRTIREGLTEEQWVYGFIDRYLYFENGILVTIQD
jgi:hypothetical protein